MRSAWPAEQKSEGEGQGLWLGTVGVEGYCRPEEGLRRLLGEEEQPAEELEQRNMAAMGPVCQDEPSGHQGENAAGDTGRGWKTHQESTVAARQETVVARQGSTPRPCVS